VAGIVVFQISVNKGRVHTRGRKAIAANVVRQVVARDGVSHRDDCALTGGIAEAIGYARTPGNGSDVEDDAALRLQVPDAGIDAVVIALDVHAHDAVEGFFRRGFDVSDLGDAGVIHQNIDASVLGDAVKRRNDLFLVADIARIGGSGASCVNDLFCDRFGVVGVEIQNARRSTIGSELECDGTSDATSGTRNECCFSVETKFVLRAQRETPRF
jgi:hypothetical protein